MKKSRIIPMLALIAVFCGAQIAVGDDIFTVSVSGLTFDKSDMSGVYAPECFSGLSYSGEPLRVLKNPLTVLKGNDDKSAYRYCVTTQNVSDPSTITEWVSFDEAVVNAPGTYYVYFMVEGNDLYNAYYCLKKERVTVNVGGTAVLKTIEYTLPETLTLKYSGKEQELCGSIIVTDPSDATVEYSLDEIRWSDSVPTASDAGEYTVFYRISASGYTAVKGDMTSVIQERTYEHHEGIAPASLDEPGYSEYWTDEDGNMYRMVNGEYYSVDEEQLYDRPYFSMKTNGSIYIVTKYNGADSDVTVPSEYFGIPIEKIDSKAFKNADITSVTICGDIIIDQLAFDGCSSLERITVEGNVEFEQSAFDGSGVSSIIILGDITAPPESYTFPDSLRVYAKAGSPAEQVMKNYYTNTMYMPDTERLVTFEWQWNGGSCSLVLRDYRGEVIESITADVTEENGEYRASAVLCGYTLTDVSDVMPDISCQMEVIADSSRIKTRLYIPDVDGGTVTVDGKTLGADDMEDGKYICEITSAAKDMDAEHTITVERNGKAIYTRSISAADYLKLVIEDDSCSSCHSTAKAMLCYGAAAQKYLKGADDGLVNDGVDGAGFDILDNVAPENNAPSKEQICSAVSAAGLDAYVSYYGMNMSFTADTSLLVAFRLNEGTDADTAKSALLGALTVKDGFTVTAYPDGSGRYVILKVENIPIKKLCDTAVSIGDVDIKGSDVIAKMVYQSKDPDCVRLYKALYNYYTEAVSV